MHNKHKRFLKKSQGGAIRSIYVPAPVTNWKPNDQDVTNIKCQVPITDQREIFNVLLRQNCQQLLKSQNSPFVQGDLHEVLTDQTKENLIDEVINDTNERLQEIVKAGEKPSLERFLKALKAPLDNEGQPMEPFEWKYGIQEYKLTFSKTKETTACGPSGLHMSHWKVAIERERIMALHAFFIWAAFRFSFSYPRWETTWHVMLQKKAHPFSQKLRIIQLFEGDFNGGLKFLLGRKLMKYATKKGYFDTDTYGSRTGKTAAEAIVNMQMIFDDSRLWRKNMAMLFNDAEGCYDRIAPLLAEIAVRKIGCPKEIAKTNSITLKNMKHHIKTAAGISKGYIKYNEEEKTVIVDGFITMIMGLVGGSGQGGGASPIIWLAILTIMLQVYKETNDGVDITNPETGLKTLYWILSYVDDNTIVKSFSKNTSIEEILDSMEKSLLEWNELLQITGGALSLQKCKISILQWKSNYWGIQSPMKTDKTKTIHIATESGSDQKVPLERIEPSKAERILGLRIPILGTMAQEYSFRKKQADELAFRLYQAPISHKEAFVIYQSRYKPTVRYCLPITLFTREELHQIQRKFIFLLLPKLGMNRHTPREVVYGPTKFGGRGIMDLRLEQPIQHLRTTIGHIRRGDNAGKALIASRITHQVIAGVENLFYTYNVNDLPYLPSNTRWRYFWSIVQQYNLTVEIWNEWLPKKQYEDDKFIMDTAINDPYFGKKKWKLEVINNCRLYLKIFTIGEMTENGKDIIPGIMEGNYQKENSQVQFENVLKPPPQAWKEWRDFLFRNFVSGKKELYPQLCLPLERNNQSIQRNGVFLDRYETLNETHKNMSQYLKDLLGLIEWPDDDGALLASAIKENEVIGASDGALDNQRTHGGYGFCLALLNTDDGMLQGGNKVPKTNNMSLLTSEMHRVISMALAVLLIATQFKIQNMKERIIILTTDNKEVVERINEECIPTNVSETWSKEYDLWKLLWEIKVLLPISIQGKWIKGHQDELDNGQKIHGPFDRATELNIKADKIATKMKNNTAIQEYTRNTSKHTGIGIYQDGKLITNLETYFYETINGKKRKY